MPTRNRNSRLLAQTEAQREAARNRVRRRRAKIKIEELRARGQPVPAELIRRAGIVTVPSTAHAAQRPRITAMDTPMPADNTVRFTITGEIELGNGVTLHSAIEQLGVLKTRVTESVAGAAMNVALPVQSDGTLRI